MRRTFRSLAPAVAAALLVAACSADAPTTPSARGDLVAPGTLTVSVAFGGPVLQGDGEVWTTVAVTNTSAQAVEVPEWFVPEGQLFDDLFVVTRDGQRVAYVGPHVKRGDLQPGDLVRLAPGATLRVDVDLAAAYDLSRDGSYSVAYDSRGADGPLPQVMRSAPRSVLLEGRRRNLTQQASPGTFAAAAGGVAAAAASISYTGRCSTTQKTQLVTAVESATTYASGSNTYLGTYNASSQRFVKWFGPASTSSWNNVKAHFTAILGAFQTKALTLDCSCKKNYYAYVYPSQPYKIYVCNAFWTAPLTGTDSRAGTLIHEMSHFTVVAATDDWAYGQTAAANLAISDAIKAMDNADSHEYFAENTPILP